MASLQPYRAPFLNTSDVSEESPMKEQTEGLEKQHLPNRITLSEGRLERVGNGYEGNA
jgi:hypothetical protein